MISSSLVVLLAFATTDPNTVCCDENTVYCQACHMDVSDYDFLNNYCNTPEFEHTLGCKGCDLEFNRLCIDWRCMPLDQHCFTSDENGVVHPTHPIQLSDVGGPCLAHTDCISPFICDANICAREGMSPLDNVPLQQCSELDANETPMPGQNCSCTTVSGSKPDTACIFPFTFNGIELHGCTKMGNGPEETEAWCSTELKPLTDDDIANGIAATHKPGFWGDCPSSCPEIPMPERRLV